MLDTEYEIPDAGYRIPDMSYGIRDVRYWIWDMRYNQDYLSPDLKSGIWYLISGLPYRASILYLQIHETTFKDKMKRTSFEKLLKIP